ncbi:MAG: CCA tRNA nucleotidyltransferase [Victivallales bacterium]|jgi:poly(A) polymerase|nr:CCA tRNA nucleotidyltransferase [Victivallales bacterium]
MRKIPFTPRYTELLKIATKVTKILKSAGFETGLVGGCVRDLWLGRTPSDCDIVTSATPEELAELFSDCRIVGAAFGVSLVRLDGFEFEVATAREERFYLDGRHPEEVRYTKELAVDVQRRDFTINALWFDPEEAVIYDTVGGIDDLERGVVRTVGDPLERFSEDYLRMLRAIRFAARLRFELEFETEQAIIKLAPKCREIAGERLKTELSQMLIGNDPSRAMRLLLKTGILAVVLPEISALVGVEQPPQFHPEGDVFTHTMLMLEHMAYPDVNLAWSVLLHDVGKAQTQSVDPDGRIRFFGHESVGEESAQKILERFRFSVAERDSVVHAVKNHMRFASVKNMKKPKLRRLLSDSNFALELELHRLDCISCHGMLDVFVFLLDLLRESPQLSTLPKPLIMGRDLIEAGCLPGPKFSRVLDAIYDKQLSGKFQTREDALKAALKLWGKVAIK